MSAVENSAQVDSELGLNGETSGRRVAEEGGGAVGWGVTPHI